MSILRIYEDLPESSAHARTHTHAQTLILTYFIYSCVYESKTFDLEAGLIVDIIMHLCSRALLNYGITF